MERVKNTSPQLEDKGGQQKSTFDRSSAFANYKLFGLANYSRPVLLAPRQPFREQFRQAGAYVDIDIMWTWAGKTRFGRAFPHEHVHIILYRSSSHLSSASAGLKRVALDLGDCSLRRQRSFICRSNSM